MEFDDRMLLADEIVNDNTLEVRDRCNLICQRFPEVEEALKQNLRKNNKDFRLKEMMGRRPIPFNYATGREFFEALTVMQEKTGVPRCQILEDHGLDCDMFMKEFERTEEPNVLRRKYVLLDKYRMEEIEKEEDDSKNRWEIRKMHQMLGNLEEVLRDQGKRWMGYRESMRYRLMKVTSRINLRQERREVENNYIAMNLEDHRGEQVAVIDLAYLIADNDMVFLNKSEYVRLEDVQKRLEESRFLKSKAGDDFIKLDDATIKTIKDELGIEDRREEKEEDFRLSIYGRRTVVANKGRKTLPKENTNEMER